jgi:hypothetical protein
MKTSSSLAAMMLRQSCAIGLVATFSTHSLADREDQWLFRLKLGSGEYDPTTIFLSDNYGSVVFRVTCDRSSGELILEYSLDREVRLAPSDTVLSIGSSWDNAVPLSTEIVEGRMVGKMKVTPKLLRIMQEPGELLIYAPNEMEEPWYVGRAEPLRRMVEICPALVER